MRWNDLKTVVVESGERVIIAVTFASGKKITIRNVPKSLTTMPNFDDKVQASAKKAKPQETYKSWGIVGDSEADKIDSPSTASSNGDSTSDKFEPTPEEADAMKAVQDLHKLIRDTMKTSVWKGLEQNPNYDLGEKQYLERSVDHEFPAGVSFEYTIDGEQFKINDIKDEIGINVIVNTKNPKKDEFGYLHTEGWPKTMGDYDDLLDIIIDVVNVGEHITTTGPGQEQKDGEPLSVTVAPKDFYYQRAIVYNVGDK